MKRLIPVAVIVAVAVLILATTGGASKDSGWLPDAEASRPTVGELVKQLRLLLPDR